MKHRHLVYLVLLVTVAALVTACGGGDGGAPALPNGGTLTVAYPDYFATQQETFALANGTDNARITATLYQADRTTPVADGTPVRFTLPAGVTFANTSSAATVPTSGGTGAASVTLSHAPVTTPVGAKNVIVPVTASALGGVGVVNVKFINQPSTVDVSVALTDPVTPHTFTGAGAVQLDISSTADVIAGGVPPASQPAKVGINGGSGGFYEVSFDAASDLSHVGCLFSPPGMTTADKVPFVKITYGLVVGINGVADFTPTAPLGGYIVANASVPPVSLILPSPADLNFAVTFRFNTE